VIKKLVLLLFPFLIAGCVQTIGTRDLDKKESIPSISYEAYFFIAGMSERSRAVFLKKPDAGVEVEPYSSEIMGSTASYAEAMSFMREKRGARTITTQVVSYKEKPIGYLLSYDQPGIDMERVYINLTERNGVIYFSAREITQADD
jgi:hypothetical protein